MVPKVGDLVFVDNNVLLTASDEPRPNHEAARRLIAESGSRDLHRALSGQKLWEYLVVATRPEGLFVLLRYRYVRGGGRGCSGIENWTLVIPEFGAG